MKKHSTVFILPFLVFVGSSLLVGLGIWGKWFGEAKEGIMMFCEHAHSGYIKQPANSFSNLAFSVVGLMMAWQTYQNKYKAKNKMTATIFYPLLLSLSLILLGAGSFAMHATNTTAGGFFDLLGMFLFSCFVSSYAIVRWFRLTDLFFILLYGLGVSIGAYLYLFTEGRFFGVLSGSTLWFAIHLLLATFFELLLRYVRKIEITAALGWAGIFTLLLAFLIWNLSRTQESVWCDPYSWFQGHAVWHVLNAVGAALVFGYYTSEREGLA